MRFVVLCLSFVFLCIPNGLAQTSDSMENIEERALHNKDRVVCYAHLVNTSYYRGTDIEPSDYGSYYCDELDSVAEETYSYPDVGTEAVIYPVTYEPLPNNVINWIPGEIIPPAEGFDPIAGLVDPIEGQFYPFTGIFTAGDNTLSRFIGHFGVIASPFDGSQTGALQPIAGTLNPVTGEFSPTSNGYNSVTQTIVDLTYTPPAEDPTPMGAWMYFAEPEGRTNFRYNTGWIRRPKSSMLDTFCRTDGRRVEVLFAFPGTSLTGALNSTSLFASTWLHGGTVPFDLTGTGNEHDGNGVVPDDMDFGLNGDHFGLSGHGFANFRIISSAIYGYMLARIEDMKDGCVGHENDAGPDGLTGQIGITLAGHSQGASVAQFVSLVLANKYYDDDNYDVTTVSFNSVRMFDKNAANIVAEAMYKHPRFSMHIFENKYDWVRHSHLAFKSIGDVDFAQVQNYAALPDHRRYAGKYISLINFGRVRYNFGSHLLKRYIQDYRLGIDDNPLEDTIYQGLTNEEMATWFPAVSIGVGDPVDEPAGTPGPHPSADETILAGVIGLNLNTKSSGNIVLVAPPEGQWQQWSSETLRRDVILSSPRIVNSPSIGATSEVSGTTDMFEGLAFAFVPKEEGECLSPGSKFYIGARYDNRPDQYLKAEQRLVDEDNTPQFATFGLYLGLEPSIDQLKPDGTEYEFTFEYVDDPDKTSCLQRLDEFRLKDSAGRVFTAARSGVPSSHEVSNLNFDGSGPGQLIDDDLYSATFQFLMGHKFSNDEYANQTP